MGHTYSGLKDILYVSGADLDPPDFHAPHQNKPFKEPNIDYSTYGSKKWWKEDATEQELASHLQKL